MMMAQRLALRQVRAGVRVTAKRNMPANPQPKRKHCKRGNDPDSNVTVSRDPT
jgi:hypothetical protein